LGRVWADGLSPVLTCALAANIYGDGKHSELAFMSGAAAGPRAHVLVLFLISAAAAARAHKRERSK
jgi:hypothetical protein